MAALENDGKISHAVAGFRLTNFKGVGATATSVYTDSSGRVSFSQIHTSAGQKSRYPCHLRVKNYSSDTPLYYMTNSSDFTSANAAIGYYSTTTSTNWFKLTARTAGSAGNSIAFVLITSGTETPLSITVTGTTITINNETDAGGDSISTPAEVVAAINAHAGAYALVAASTTSTQTGAVTAAATATLTGGYNKDSEAARSAALTAQHPTTLGLTPGAVRVVPPNFEEVLDYGNVDGGNGFRDLLFTGATVPMALTIAYNAEPAA